MAIETVDLPIKDGDFPLNMVIYLLKMVIYLLKMVIYLLKMVIYLLKMVIYLFKVVIYLLKMVIFHSYVSLCFFGSILVLASKPSKTSETRLRKPCCRRKRLGCVDGFEKWVGDAPSVSLCHDNCQFWIIVGVFTFICTSLLIFACSTPCQVPVTVKSATDWYCISWNWLHPNSTGLTRLVPTYDPDYNFIQVDEMRVYTPSQ